MFQGVIVGRDSNRGYVHISLGDSSSCRAPASLLSRNVTGNTELPVHWFSECNIPWL